MTDQALAPYMKKLFATVVITLGVLMLLYAVRLAWTPIIWIGIAAFLAVAINPIIHWLQRYMPRQSVGLATFLVLLVLCGASIALAWAFFVPLVQQTARLIAALPDLANKANQALAATPFADTIATTSSQAASSASQLGNALLAIITGTVEAVVAFVTIVALMFFMTLEGKTIKETTNKLTPAKMRKDAQELGSKVYGIINGYVVGNFLLSMLYGLCSGLLLWLLGSPYFLILGFIAALLDLIPLIGSTIAAIIIALVCLLTGQVWMAAVFVVFTIIYVQVENAVLNPLVYSKKVDISPLTVLIAVLIGAAIAGVVGTLLAIPVAATIKETSKVLLKYRRAEA